jgi:hypothetical protein
LVVAEGALLGSGENWFPGGPEEKARLREARTLAQLEARKVARRTRQARRFNPPLRAANHW